MVSEIETEISLILKNILKSLDRPPERNKNVQKLEEELEEGYFRELKINSIIDTPAYVDFSVYTFAADHIYAVPTSEEEESTVPLLIHMTNSHLDNIGKNLDSMGIDPHIINTVKETTNSKQGVEALKYLRTAIKFFEPFNQPRARRRDFDEIIEPEPGYNFDLFYPGEINVGAKLIYRQIWRPIKYQTGELLYTIPLAPGEKVKYETKAWETTKTAEEINESSLYSSEEVLSATKRFIAEVKNRSKRTFRFETETDGGVNFGVWKANGSAKGSVDYEKESTRSKKLFREMMRKSSESIKEERKVTINISTEIGSESKMIREISNPNEEITVTYLFYELQRVYEVSEELYDFVPVVYVANPVPPKDKINEDWIIKHDWLIAGAILDRSFIENLTFISQGLPGLEYAYDTANNTYLEALGTVQEIKAGIREEREKIEKLKDSLEEAGANFMDKIATFVAIRETRARIEEQEKKLTGPLKALAETQKTLADRTFEYEQGKAKSDRLKNHIQDNILHYMQAIWDSEPYGQRYLKLHSLEYSDMVYVGGPDVDDDGNLINPEFEEKGLPQPLTDVIDVTNPLGYVGNYTAYRLLRDDNDMINWTVKTFLPSEFEEVTTDSGETILEKVTKVTDPEVEENGDTRIEIKIPTDAIFIEALPGKYPLLEQFKLMHRSIDMDRARQEFVGQQIENLRRLELIRKGDLGDPEFQKTIVSDAHGLLLEKVAGLSSSEPEGDESGGGGSG